MRWDKIAEKMCPANANDAWWEGLEAWIGGDTVNPHPISDENGEDVPEYWYWDAGWWWGYHNR